MAELGQSEIRAMTQACVAAGGLNMAQGVCDTPVPPVVLKSAAEAMVQGRNSYSRFDGLPELRQALAVKLDRDNGIRADPETDITVSAGATGAFHSACMALLNPGDEVILFQPYYQYHISALLAVEGRLEKQDGVQHLIAKRLRDLADVLGPLAISSPKLATGIEGWTTNTYGVLPIRPTSSG